MNPQEPVLGFVALTLQINPAPSGLGPWGLGLGFRVFVSGWGLPGPYKTKPPGVPYCDWASVWV